MEGQKSEEKKLEDIIFGTDKTAKEIYNDFLGEQNIIEIGQRGYLIDLRMKSNPKTKNNPRADPTYSIICRNKNADLRFTGDPENQVYIPSISSDNFPNPFVVKCNGPAEYWKFKNEATHREGISVSLIHSKAVTIFMDWIRSYSAKNYNPK